MYGATEAQATATLTLTASAGGTTQTTPATQPTKTGKQHAPPAPASGGLRVMLSSHTVLRGGRLRITVRGESRVHSAVELPITLRAYVATSCTGPNGYGYHLRAVFKVGGGFQRSFEFRFGTNIYAGRFHVCAYLLSEGKAYAHATAALTYEGRHRSRLPRVLPSSISSRTQF
jgi:hypothetical protein